MIRLPYTIHYLKSREELTSFMNAGIIRKSRVDIPALKRYLSAFGTQGGGFPGRPMTDRGRAYGLRYRPLKDDGQPDALNYRSGIQMRTRHASFPFTSTWSDVLLPADYILLKQFLSVERVFCDCAVYMMEHPQ